MAEPEKTEADTETPAEGEQTASPEAPAETAPVVRGPSPEEISERRRRRLFLALSAVNLVTCLVIGGFFFRVFQANRDKPRLEDIVKDSLSEEEELEFEKAKERAAVDASNMLPGVGDRFQGKYARMMALDRFVVNLQTDGPSDARYVRTLISMDVRNRELHQEAKDKLPKIQHTIIEILSSRTAGDLATAQGRDFARGQMLAALNTFMTKGKIRSLWIQQMDFGK